MRLEAQKKGGFYPIPLPALDEVLSRVSPPENGEKFYICDPCCGEAEALAHIKQRLEADHRRVFGVELEPGRYAQAVNRLPDCHILGPANFLSCAITDSSFSFVWLNPPFDDEIGGGGRVEHEFLKSATRTLVPGGIMAFCCPEDTAGRWDINQHFAMFYDDLSIMKFPEQHRRFTEVVVFGRKVPELVYKERYHNRRVEYSEAKLHYTMPKGYYPFKFYKSELTAEELEAAVGNSPLNRLIQSTHAKPVPSPPLSLGKGHVALLLASGHLDGVVSPPGEEPHLVRGTARKISYVSNIENEADEESGKERTIVTESERITLTIRTLQRDGTIKTFLDKPVDVHATETQTAQPTGESK